MGLGEEIKKELEKSHSIDEVKTNLVRRGYLESDIDETIRNMLHFKSEEHTKNNRILSIKELFDRIGYGFASQQFVNILFLLSGASLFLIGFINSLKTALTFFFSGVFKQYARLKSIGKNLIATSGMIFGFSFLGMAFAVVLASPLLFTISLLVGSMGIIAHGDLYTTFYNKLLKNEKRKNFLRFVSYFGILITAFSLLLAGFITEKFPVEGKQFTIDLGLESPLHFNIYGYLLTFEVTAIMFIVSGYMLSFLDEDKDKPYSAASGMMHSVKSYISESMAATAIFTKNKKVFLLTMATILTTIVQVLGNSYYGIYIYEHFKNQFMKGFLNVAVIFVIAIITSITGTLLTKRYAKSLGEAPMLVFGTLLVALLPVTFYFNPNLYAIGLATALSVIGGAIVGVAQGLIAERLMDEEELKTYFDTLGFVSIVPVLVLAALGALVAQLMGVEFLFLAIAIVLALVIMPIYFAIVLIVDKEYHAERAMFRK